MTPTYSLALCTLISLALSIEQPPAAVAAAPVITRLDKETFTIGPIRIDTRRRELSVPAAVNKVTTLEFVANTKGGFKAYESALTVDTDAISFNTALLLLGLDPKNARVPLEHFDAIPPHGDPVEMFVEWQSGRAPTRVRVEELLFDRRTQHTVPEGPWVYTGSMFLTDHAGVNQYLAALDGVLIGFVHSPSPIIENPRAGAVNAYGSVVFNENIGLKPDMTVTLTIRALPQTP